MKSTLTTALLTVLMMKDTSASCNSNADCTNGQTCYRPGTQYSLCLNGGQLGGAQDNIPEMQEIFDYIFDLAQSNMDDTPECQRVSDAVQTTLSDDMQDSRCEPMFEALNITYVDPIDDHDSQGDFDASRLDGMLLYDMIRNKAELDRVCGSPCFPMLWATSTRAGAICYDQKYPTQFDYICSSNGQEYCLNYADDIAQVFSELQADGTSSSEIIGVLGSQCSLISSMGCCFSTYLEIYELFRSRLHEAILNLPDDVLNTDQGQQMKQLDELLQAISTSNIKLFTSIACGVHASNDCPVPPAIEDAVSAVEEEYPYPSSSDHNGGGNGGDNDNSPTESSSKSGGEVAGVVVVLVLVAAVAGVTFYYLRKRSNRFDGARVVAGDRIMHGEVVDIDESGQKGSYVPVVIDENSAMGVSL